MRLFKFSQIKLITALSSLYLLNQKNQKSFIVRCDDANMETDKIIRIFKEVQGIPGLIVGVNVDGKTRFLRAYGYSDVENLIPANELTVTRIGSISKPITMAILGKLLQDKRIDLDAPIHKYVPDFPHKNITLKQLVTHMSGLRHYDKECIDIKRIIKKLSTAASEDKTSEDMSSKTESNQNSEEQRMRDNESTEFYLNTPFKSVQHAIDLFKNDDLCIEPDTHFLYTTHGWTLISAAIEACTHESIIKTFSALFEVLGMSNSHVDSNAQIIPHRSKFYVRDKKTHGLKNVPSVDNSYKWAGGGLLSNVPDLIEFAKAMLASYQHCNLDDKNTGNSPYYLDCKIMRQIWSPLVKTGYKTSVNAYYGMGWFVQKFQPFLSSSTSPTLDQNLNHDNNPISLKMENAHKNDTNNITKDHLNENSVINNKKSNDIIKECPACNNNFQRRVSIFQHSGGSVGATSILAILAEDGDDIFFDSKTSQNLTDIKGIIVVILTNLEEVNHLTQTAIDIAKLNWRHNHELK